MSKKPAKGKSKKSAKATAPKEAPSTPAIRMVEIEAKLPLTDAEARQRSKIAWEKRQERDRLVLERKQVASEYKARIDALSAEEFKLLEESSEGLELRTVKAREIRIFERNVVEYHFKGQCIHSRPMTLADRQDELPIVDKQAPVPKVSTSAEADDAEDIRPTALRRPTQKAAKHDPVEEAHAADDEAKRRDVAGVIAEQTNVRSAWTQTDGARA